MNKSELIDIIAAAADISKAAAGQALDAVTDGIKTSLSKGEMVTLIGFGSFVIRNRAARSGHNPRTGEAMQIKASKNPVFKPSKVFKDAFNKDNKDK